MNHPKVVITDIDKKFESEQKENVNENLTLINKDTSSEPITETTKTVFADKPIDDDVIEFRSDAARNSNNLDISNNHNGPKKDERGKFMNLRTLVTRFYTFHHGF